MTDCGYFNTAQNGNHSSFLTPTVVGGRRPVPSEICAESGPPPLRNADFDQFPLITSQPYDIAKKSSIMTNKKSTTGFPTSYSWSAYVTPRSRKGGSKSDFFVFDQKSTSIE